MSTIRQLKPSNAERKRINNKSQTKTRNLVSTKLLVFCYAFRKKLGWSFVFGKPPREAKKYLKNFPINKILDGNNIIYENDPNSPNVEPTEYTISWKGIGKQRQEKVTKFKPSFWNNTYVIFPDVVNSRPARRSQDYMKDELEKLAKQNDIEVKVKSYDDSNDIAEFEIKYYSFKNESMEGNVCCRKYEIEKEIVWFGKNDNYLYQNLEHHFSGSSEDYYFGINSTDIQQQPLMIQDGSVQTNCSYAYQSIPEQQNQYVEEVPQYNANNYDGNDYYNQDEINFRGVMNCNGVSDQQFNYPEQLQYVNENNILLSPPPRNCNVGINNQLPPPSTNVSNASYPHSIDLSCEDSSIETNLVRNNNVQTQLPNDTAKLTSPGNNGISELSNQSYYDGSYVNIMNGVMEEFPDPDYHPGFINYSQP